jgi:hypothetical protein
VIRGRGRGQSETVGFVLVFALIVVSTGIVYVAGFSTLDDARTTEELRNMERAFDVLDDNIDDVARRDAPARSTEIRLGNGDLSFGEPINVTVTANGSTDNFTRQPLVYRLDGSSIVYSSGAVIRTDRGNSVMRSGPGWVVDDRRVLLTWIDVRQSGDSVAVGGDTTALVRVRSGTVPNVASVTSDTPFTVTVSVESPRADAWRQYFLDRGFDSCTPVGADDEVSCSVTTERFHYIKVSTDATLQP